MSSVLITSDLHLGHKVAAKYRGFSDVESHDEFIIKTLSRFCTKRTLLLVLGDVAFNILAMSRLNEINCTKKLIKGNHDNLSLYEYGKIFKDIHGMLEYKDYCLTHCPIHPQEMHRYKGNIHGHIHKDTKTKSLPPPYYNVNWDFFSKPIEITDIIGYSGTPPNSNIGNSTKYYCL